MIEESPTDDPGELDATVLDELATQLRQRLHIKTRSHGVPRREYPMSFIGSEAVQAMIDAQIAADVDEALRIGNLLLDGGFFHHVLDEHRFENRRLYYRYYADEDHGKTASTASGASLSWADLLRPAVAPPEGGEGGLQPQLPERNPGLADFDQVDLETIGVSPLDAHNNALLDSTHPRQWLNPTGEGRYNLLVLGAGAGGLVSAAAAAGVGARVALVEAHLLGGDCLNVGCVPSKALLRSARAVAAVRDAQRLGVHVEGAVTVNFATVMERMRRLRAKIAPHDSARRYADEFGVDVFIGRGCFTSTNSLEVDGRRLEFARAIVATGGTAALPPIPGLAQAPYLTNASIFNLTELPARLGVIGAGPIGLEMAQSFRRFGAEVTVLSRGARILPKEDPEAAELVRASMLRDGVNFLGDVKFNRVDGERAAAPIRLHAEIGGAQRTLAFDALLVATGRKPAVAGLGLEHAGVEFDPRMGVTVDDQLRTTNPNIYAVGDVATRFQFTHVADFMARMAVRNALFFGREQISKLLIPWATYTDPEVAHVGLYEQDLVARGIPYATFRRDLAEVDRAILDGVEDGFVKVHVRKGRDQILGATIVAPHAGEMIGEITVAMRAGMGLGALADVIHPYPTVSEAIRQCGDAYNRTRLTPTVRKLFNRLMAVRRG